MQQRQRRLEGCDATGLALYARGLSTRAMQAPLEALSGVEVSPPLISTVPDAGCDAGRAWQARPLAYGPWQERQVVTADVRAARFRRLARDDERLAETLAYIS